jgi:purine-binding chemotaxis protein CheW
MNKYFAHDQNVLYMINFGAQMMNLDHEFLNWSLCINSIQSITILINKFSGAALVAAKKLVVLHVALKDIQVCIHLHYIKKVLPLPWLEIVPSSPVHFVGLMNLKNQCIPVVDLAVCLGLPRNETYPLNIPLLLCSDGGQELCLIVDKVLGLDELEEQQINKTKDFGKSNSSFMGTVTLDRGVSLLLNMDWIFNLQYRLGGLKANA